MTFYDLIDQLRQSALRPALLTRLVLLRRPSPRRPSLVAVQVLSVLLLASLSVGAAAQTQFAPALLPGIAQLPVPFNPLVPVLADFDGDGGLDLLVNEPRPLYLFMNNGLGEFRDESATRLPPPPFGFFPSWVMADDVDRDRDLDILVVDAAGPVRIYINNGRGVFADETATRFLDPRPGSHAWGSMGDLDGDGDRDILVDTFAAPPYAAVYLNDGTGVFRPAAAMIQGAFYLTVSGACADLDGNGTDEILLTKFGCQLFVNTGTAFVSRPFPASAEWANNVAFADVDGDGDPDVLQGSAGQNRLYMNLGNLQFVDVTATQMPKDTDVSFAYAGDLDSDGAVDCFMANGRYAFYQADRFYRNDGAGNFTDVTAQRMIQTGEPSWYAALGDVDRDGDLDVLTTDFSSSMSITYYANRLRHVSSVASPRIGATWQVSVYDRPRFSTQAALCYLLLNSALLQPPVRVGQFGWLGVSVTGLIPWAPVLIPAPGGAQTIQIPVPAQAFLVGTQVVAQAVIVPAVVSGVRLTNVLHDVIQ